jgi:hypothetical protein
MRIGEGRSSDIPIIPGALATLEQRQHRLYKLRKRLGTRRPSINPSERIQNTRGSAVLISIRPRMGGVLSDRLPIYELSRHYLAFDVNGANTLRG